MRYVTVERQHYIDADDLAPRPVFRGPGAGAAGGEDDAGEETKDHRHGLGGCMAKEVRYQELDCVSRFPFHCLKARETLLRCADMSCARWYQTCSGHCFPAEDENPPAVANAAQGEEPTNVNKGELRALLLR